MFEAARNVYFLWMYCSPKAKATYCQHCADKKLKIRLPKVEERENLKPRKSKQCLLLDFRGPISYINEYKVLVAADCLSKGPSAKITA